MINFKTLPHGKLQSLLLPHTVHLTGIWYRAIQLKFTATALHYLHTKTQTGRFSAGTPAAPAHPLLYLAENHHVALLEVSALFSPPGTGTFVPSPVYPWAVLNVGVSLSRISDLTSAKAQQDLKTTAQELTGDWAGYWLRGLAGASVTGPTGTAPTQQLGAALYGVPDLQGFLTISAKAPDRKNLVVFPDKIKMPTADFIEFTDPATGTIHRIP